jgi:amino acid transporter
MWRRLGIALLIDLVLIGISLWGWSHYNDDSANNPWWVLWSLVLLVFAAAAFVWLVFRAAVQAVREFRDER